MLSELQDVETLLLVPILTEPRLVFAFFLFSYSIVSRAFLTLRRPVFDIAKATSGKIHFVRFYGVLIVSVVFLFSHPSTFAL
jgi:hypothetical protein